MNAETFFLSPEARVAVTSETRLLIEGHLPPCLSAIVLDYAPLPDGQAIATDYLLSSPRFGWMAHRDVGDHDLPTSFGIGRPYYDNAHPNQVTLARHGGTWLLSLCFINIDDAWRFLCAESDTVTGKTLDSWVSGESAHSLVTLRAKLLEELNVQSPATGPTP